MRGQSKRQMQRDVDDLRSQVAAAHRLIDYWREMFHESVKAEAASDAVAMERLRTIKALESRVLELEDGKLPASKVFLSAEEARGLTSDLKGVIEKARETFDELDGDRLQVWMNPVLMESLGHALKGMTGRTELGDAVITGMRLFDTEVVPHDCTGDWALAFHTEECTGEGCRQNRGGLGVKP